MCVKGTFCEEFRQKWQCKSGGDWDSHLLESSRFNDYVEVVRCTVCEFAVAFFKSRNGCPVAVRYERWKFGEPEMLTPMRRIRTFPLHHFN